jgi:hypothetical protein
VESGGVGVRMVGGGEKEVDLVLEEWEKDIEREREREANQRKEMKQEAKREMERQRTAYENDPDPSGHDELDAFEPLDLLFRPPPLTFLVPRPDPKKLRLEHLLPLTRRARLARALLAAVSVRPLEEGASSRTDAGTGRGRAVVGDAGRREGELESYRVSLVGLEMVGSGRGVEVKCRLGGCGEG